MASKTNVSDYRFSIFINNDQAKQAVIEMEGQVKKYQEVLNDLQKSGQNKDSGPWKAAKADLDQANASLVSLKKEAGLTSLSIKDLKSLQQSLMNEFARSSPGSPAYKQIEKELQAVGARIDEVKFKSQNISKDAGAGGGLMEKILGVAGGMTLANLAEKAFGQIKNAIDSTHGSAEKFHILMAGIDSGYQAFLRTIANGDWSNFLTNIKEAVKYGEKYAEFMEEYGRKEESHSLQQIARQTEIIKLRKDLRNQTLSDAERLQKERDIMVLQNIGLKENIDLKQSKLNIDLEGARLQTGLSDAQIISFVKNYNDNAKEIDQAKEFNKLLEEKIFLSKQGQVSSAGGTGGYQANPFYNPERLKEVNTEISKTPPIIQATGRLITSFAKGKEDLFKTISTGIKDTYLAQNEYQAQTLKDETTAHKIEAKNAMETRSGRKKEETEQQKSFKKIQEDYKKLMDSITDMDGKNFANKLNETQQEVKNVEDKYDTLIKAALKFKADNEKLLKDPNLAPARKKEIQQENSTVDNNIGTLEIERDKQTKQVLEQAEADFAKKVAEIHENLRVARMSITGREVYEINKKYDDAQKEILDTIQFRYDQEVKEANGNVDKIVAAENRKKEELAKIQDPISKLNTARKDETDKAVNTGNVRFNDDLNNLKLKGEKDLADGKEKIQLELNEKYKKILDENVNDQSKVNEIKSQMAQEQADREAQLANEATKKVIQKAIDLAKTGVEGLSQIYSMQSKAEEDKVAEDEASNNKKKANLKKQLDGKQIDQKKYDAEVAKLDLDLDKKKRKLEHDQAERNREIALFNAMINVATAVAGALANPPGPGGIVMSIITAALGAIQVGYILSSKVPEAAMGRYDVINQVMSQSKTDVARQSAKSTQDVVGENDGKLYKDVPYQKSFTGIPGKPMLVNETGNEIVIDPYTTKNLVMNYPKVLQAIQYARVPQRAAGQYPDFGIPSSTQAPPPIIIFPAGFKEALDEFNTHARNGLNASISYDVLQKENGKVDQTIKDTTR